MKINSSIVLILFAIVTIHAAVSDEEWREFVKDKVLLPGDYSCIYKSKVIDRNEWIPKKTQITFEKFEFEYRRNICHIKGMFMNDNEEKWVYVLAFTSRNWLQFLPTTDPQITPALKEPYYECLRHVLWQDMTPENRLIFQKYWASKNTIDKNASILEYCFEEYELKCQVMIKCLDVQLNLITPTLNADDKKIDHVPDNDVKNFNEQPKLQESQTNIDEKKPANEVVQPQNTYFWFIVVICILIILNGIMFYLLYDQINTDHISDNNYDYYEKEMYTYNRKENVGEENSYEFTHTEEWKEQEKEALDHAEDESSALFTETIEIATHTESTDTLSNNTYDYDEKEIYANNPKENASDEFSHTEEWEEQEKEVPEHTEDESSALFTETTEIATHTDSTDTLFS